MRIYSMMATFGKLEHQTLMLQPGLNVIEAPNEWGKSTWCAFLINMLYGIDTRARTTGAAVADKERYAPWSGSAMAGRIDLNWNGRDITIERSSKGRVIFGNFRAYETESGVDVPELNGLNCGQMLLGVERSVFARAGFLKLNDLPVTQDESLRRRLNNLVTTGDESGAGDQLGEQLKNLKNKCRHNRTGLLPQAETERDQLKNQLSTLHGLQNRAEQIQAQQAQLENIIAELKNHADSLRYAASQEDLRRISTAEEELEENKRKLAAVVARCEQLPDREEVLQKLHQAGELLEQQRILEAEERMLPALPEKPEIPEYYRGVAAAKADEAENARLERAKKRRGLIIAVYSALAVAALIAGVLLPHILVYVGAAVALAGVVVIGACGITTTVIRKEQNTLYDRYPGIAPGAWVADAEKYSQLLSHYEALCANAQMLRKDLDDRKMTLRAQIDGLLSGESPENARVQWQKALDDWDALTEARRQLQQQDSHVAALRSMVKACEPPKKPDRLTYSREENDRLLAEAGDRMRQLHMTLGQCQGQAESLGSEERIRARLDTLNHRIERLEDTYYALEMAQDALRDATLQLQRRFAPRIAKRAQELFGKLTEGRYQRLTLGEDLSLSASALDEDTLHGVQWRSDGTADQLYLALRLAVAEELTPEAPLVLDDAFVRFDDERLKAAMAIVKEEAKTKQVILFTCQHREKELEEVL